MIMGVLCFGMHWIITMVWGVTLEELDFAKIFTGVHGNLKLCGFNVEKYIRKGPQTVLGGRGRETEIPG